MKTKYMNKKAIMSYSQILILMISLFAFSFLVYQSSQPTKIINEKPRINFIKILGLNLLNKLKEPMIPLVSAAPEDPTCCEKVISGDHAGSSCQFVTKENCDPLFASAESTECKYTDFCKKGCCISQQTGFCNKNAIESDCQEGKWFEDEFCNIPQCERGCCVLGNQASLLYPGECEKESEARNLEIDFRSEITSESACTYLTEVDDEGACVLESTFDTKCEFITKGICENKQGDFYKNQLCSNKTNSCIAKDHTGCLEGEGSVYWFDSCGNKEGIKEECSLYAGSYCSPYRSGINEVPDVGDYICRDINCKNTMNGKDYDNAESWCVYEGSVEDGRDVVGSRHVRHTCFMGEERIEPCEDYRNQICVGSESNEGFSESSCRANNWRYCIDYNTMDDRGEGNKKCEENPDCRLQQVAISKFAFKMCVPNHPPGFDFSSNAGRENAETVCGMASQQCTVVSITDWKGKCKVKINKDCKSSVFTQQMNDLCTSLGDCGGYINIAGKYTDEGYRSSAGDIDGKQYEKYATTDFNQLIKPGNLSFLGRYLSTSNEGSGDGSGSREGEEDGLGVDSIDTVGLGAVGVGFAAQVASWYVTFSNAGIGTAIQGAAAQGGLLAGETTVTGITTVGEGAGAFGAWGNAAAGAGAILIISSLAISVLGLQGEGAKIVQIAGYIAAGLTAFTALGAFGATAQAGLSTLPGMLGFVPYDPVTLILFIIVIAVVKILGIGEVCKEQQIKFECKPYQPPRGGSDCGKCNDDDEFNPCSEYKCQSLGQTCELINKGGTQEKCIDNNPNDVTSPKISPMISAITSGYQYVDTNHNNYQSGFEILNNSDKCIPEFTRVKYGIQTTKPAQCRIGTDPLKTYEEMEYFGGSNFYLTNHTTELFLPSISAFRNRYNLTNAQIKSLGTFEYYVKCKSVNGVKNSASYTIKSCVEPGPDITVPYITYSTPGSGYYTAYDQTEQKLDLRINEPAKCKWSRSDLSYANMENNFECQYEFEDYTTYGWPCNTTITGLSNNDSLFYIRCNDQPLGEEDDRNPMTQSHEYELLASKSELVIKEIRPEEGKEIIDGTEPITVNLRVETSGGINGVATCYYHFGDGRFIKFGETFDIYHKQVLSWITRGDYNVNLKCEDVAGNIAEESTSFKVKLDTSSPKIIRFYFRNGLKIITNEDAECRYGFDKEFKFDEASEMSGDGIEHFADWKSKTYYIQCKDKYDRKGRVIRVRAYNLL